VEASEMPRQSSSSSCVLFLLRHVHTAEDWAIATENRHGHGDQEEDVEEIHFSRHVDGEEKETATSSVYHAPLHPQLGVVG
jgi:hypothetical protein